MYPALAVASRLAELAPEVELGWIGGKGGMERKLVAEAEPAVAGKLSFEAISAAGIHGVGLSRLVSNLSRLALGFFQAFRLIARRRPAVLFLTGGYLAAPVGLAAWLLRVPIVVYVPDIEPGLALRLVSRLAARILVTVESARRYYGSGAGVMVTGYPVRAEMEEVLKAGAPPRAASDRPTVLVFGGSRGARSINRALEKVLPELLQEVDVIHISGEVNWGETNEARERLPEEGQTHYRAFPHLPAREMAQALRAADLVVSRAGASTLGEFPLFGLPAVLVPYPHAWRYQKMNADYLVERGAAVTLNDEDLDVGLLEAVRGVLRDWTGLEAMRSAARSLAVPGAARRIAQEVLDAGVPPGSRRAERTPAW